MKILVGKRAKVDPELKMMMALVERCLLPPGRRTSTVISYQFFCEECQEPVICTLSEDVKTGEVWAEVLDFCPKCKHKLATENPEFEPLKQKDIYRLFGQF